VDVLLIDDNCGAIDPMLLREVMICARVSKATVVLVISGPHAAENAFRAARAGVSAIAHRSHDPRFLAFAVASARSGRRWLDPELAAEMILGGTAARAGAALRDRLTPREKEVLDGLCAGMSNAELAAIMFVSARTVKFHVSNVLAKLGVRTREQAIAMFFAVPQPGPETRTDPVPQGVGGAGAAP